MRGKRNNQLLLNLTIPLLRGHGCWTVAFFPGHVLLFRAICAWVKKQITIIYFKSVFSSTIYWSSPHTQPAWAAVCVVRIQQNIMNPHYLITYTFYFRDFATNICLPKPHSTRYQPVAARWWKLELTLASSNWNVMCFCLFLNI